MATILVTGASGAIGQRLLAGLRSAGWRTRALVHRRPATGADEVVRGDLANVATLDEAAAGVDAIVHLAAATHARSRRRYQAVNLTGTKNLLGAAQRHLTGRFVHVSTRAISPDGGAYSRSKLAAEEAVQSSRLDYTIVRLPELYGTGGSEGVDRLISLARRGAPIPIAADGSGQLCPVLIDDVIPALVAAADSEAARCQTYTLAGECTTVRRFAESCRSAFGSSGRLVPVPFAVLSALALIGRIAPSPVYPDQLARLRSPKPPLSRQARADLGFEPRSVAEGLRLAGGERRAERSSERAC